MTYPARVWHAGHRAEERMTLESIVRFPSSAQRDVLRARIVLLAASDQRNEHIQAILKVSRPVVIKWRRCFAAQRPDGLRDQASQWRKRKYDAAIRQRIAATGCGTPPALPRWSVRTLARHSGVGTLVVQSVLAAKPIQTCRFRYGKHSNDPEFEPT